MFEKKTLLILEPFGFH